MQGEDSLLAFFMENLRQEQPNNVDASTDSISTQIAPLLQVIKHPYASKRYSVLLADPPWSYYGDAQKNAAAGKHYNLMTDEDIKKLPIKNILAKNAYVFLWATCPKLDLAIETLKAWGLHYRGVGHVWVKTNKSGNIIHGQGIPPTYSKPTTELLLVATTSKKGRPLKLLNSAIPQVVLASRQPKGHSAKPKKFHDLIENAFPNSSSRLEVFARERQIGWDAIGDGVEPGIDIRDSLKGIIDE